MTTLKGIFPEPIPARKRNFIHENVKSLRRMEQCFHTNKEIDELQKFQGSRYQKIIDKYPNVTAKVNTSLRGKKNDDQAANLITNNNEIENMQPVRKASVPTLNKKCNSLAKKTCRSLATKGTIKQKKQDYTVKKNDEEKLEIKVLSDPNFTHKQMEGEENSRDARVAVKHKNQSIQTLDEKQMERLYAEGIIRYPTKRSGKLNEGINKNNSSQQNERIASNHLSPPSDRGDIYIADDTQLNAAKILESSLHDEGVDFIKLNKERTSIASKVSTRLNNGVPPANYRKGVVPKYIRDRKEAQQKEEEAKAAASHPDCPEGHVPLPDNERKETLRMLKKNYQDYVNELNMMPIKTDTLRAQRRKIEIEKQLNKLEEGIKVFSRPKVYVKVNT